VDFFWIANAGALESCPTKLKLTRVETAIMPRRYPYAGGRIRLCGNEMRDDVSNRINEFGDKATL